MKLTLGLLVFFPYLVAIQCSLQTIVANPGGIGGIFKGPDSETIVKGPDGSVITSEQQGGFVQTDHKLEPIIVAEPEIVQANPVFSPSLVEDGYIAPLVPVQNVVSTGDLDNIVPVNPIGPALLPAIQETVPISLDHTVNIVEPEPHIIETEIVDAPAIEPKESTDLVGPSGSISTRGSESIVSGPASTTITKTAKVLVAPPVITATAIKPYPTPAVIAPPLIEVNNEIPVAVSPGPILTATLRPPAVFPINTGSFLPVSTLLPPVASAPFSQGVAFQQPVSPTPSPPAPTAGPVFTTGLLTGEQFDGRYYGPTTINSLQVDHDQKIIPQQTPRVNIEDEGASGFIQQGYGAVPSSTLSPIFSTTSSFYEGIPSSTISPISTVTSSGNINQQRVLNPSNIPTRNIIPPEIGAARGVIDLGATVTSVTKEHDAPGLINLQGIDTDNIQRAEQINDANDETFQNGYYRTNILLGSNPNSVYPPQARGVLNAPLLTETHPILYQNVQNGIPHAGTVSVSPVSEVSSHSDYSDGAAAAVANLGNRYSRKIKHRKY